MSLEEINSRNSLMYLDEIYFWTDTIKDWKRLLNHDTFKRVIISSLQELVSREKIIVYAFVIMPNHIHLIWEMKELNGKEMPHASFNKFTSHQIVELLKKHDPTLLLSFTAVESDPNYRIWQRDPLAVLMDTRKKLEQKIEYIHLNPLQAHWNLAVRPELYFWSSAAFYERGRDDFGFLTHYLDRI